MFEIRVEGSIVIDAGGVTKEWFTRLAKEKFNQNYALFNCTVNKKCYMTNSKSYIHPDHLNYFKFVIMFIVCALIEGICIDANLTTFFCKQIFHRKDIDESLFSSLQWILKNDVKQLSLYFEINTNDFGEHRAIKLKENGSQIEVTNENKFEYVYLRANYALYIQIKKKIEKFCSGFDELIPHKYLRLICSFMDSIQLMRMISEKT